MATDGTSAYLAVCRCGRWYVRRRLDQSFCKAECRTAFRRSSEKFKAHRRDYMRYYYANYQSPKAPKKKLTFQQWQNKRIAQTEARNNGKKR